MLKKHTQTKKTTKKQIKKTKLSLQLFLMASFDRVREFGKDADLRIS